MTGFKFINIVIKYNLIYTFTINKILILPSLGDLLLFNPKHLTGEVTIQTALTTIIQNILSNSSNVSISIILNTVSVYGYHFAQICVHSIIIIIPSYKDYNYIKKNRYLTLKIVILTYNFVQGSATLPRYIRVC